MRLIIIRHATAVPRGTPDMPDDDRPLSVEGERRFLKAARGLALLSEPPDVVLASPFLRARRTAEIAAAAWGGVPLQVDPVLAEGTPGQIALRLSRLSRKSGVAIVGHEPTLSSLLASLVGAGASERFELKKGGAACIEADARVESGTLLWFAPPRLLRDLADGVS